MYFVTAGCFVMVKMETKALKRHVNKIIEDYSLIELFEQVKGNDDGYLSLDTEKKENLILGCVKLGEALTFFRYNGGANQSFSDSRENGELSRASSEFTNFRNYLVHHLMYEPTEVAKNSTISSKILALPNLEALRNLVEEVKLTSLNKNTRAGSNKFKFGYEHQLDTLKKKISIVKRLSEADAANTGQELSSGIQNHVRSCLCIILDLKSDTNKYITANPEIFTAHPDKISQVKSAIEQFIEDNPGDDNLLSFFHTMTSKRNDLSHFLNTASGVTIKELPEIITSIVTLEKKGFVDALTTAISANHTKKLDSHSGSTVNIFTKMKSGGKRTLPQKKRRATASRVLATVLSKEKPTVQTQNPLAGLMGAYGDMPEEKPKCDKTPSKDDGPASSKFSP